MKSLFLTAILSLSFNAQAQVSVMGVIASGSGCPEGSVQVQLSPDASSITVLYDRFNVLVGPGVPQALGNCKLRIALKKPLLAGFGIYSADFRGFVGLEAGVQADQQVRVTSAPTPELRQVVAEFGSAQFRGPVNQNYNLTTVRPLRTPQIVNCLPREKTWIEIESQVRLFSDGIRQGQMTVDSTDGRLVQRYNLRWQNCANDAANIIDAIIRKGRRP